VKKKYWIGNNRDKTKTEKQTVFLMIKIYCNHHHNKNSICDDCSNLYNYAVQRIEKCPFGTKKPVCSECIVHCYNHEMREQIRSVMRFSGPKMILKHPVLAFTYLVKKRFSEKQNCRKVP